MSAEQPSRWDRVRELRARQSALAQLVEGQSNRVSAFALMSFKRGDRGLSLHVHVRERIQRASAEAVSR